MDNKVPMTPIKKNWSNLKLRTKYAKWVKACIVHMAVRTVAPSLDLLYWSFFMLGACTLNAIT